MKSIRLFFLGTKAIIKQSPVIYAVFLFFCVFTTVVGIYATGKYSGDLMVYDNYSDSLTTFSLSVDWFNGTPFSEIKEAINKTAADPNVDYIQLRIRDRIVDWESTDSTGARFAIAYAKNENKMISDYLKKSGIKNVDAADFASDSNDAIIIENLQVEKSDASIEQDGTFDIQGSTYNVLHKLSLGEEDQVFHLISYKSVQKNNPRVMMLLVKYNQLSSFQEIEKIANRLRIDFPGTVKVPVERNYNIESILSMGNVLVYLVIILSGVNYIYIYRYIIYKRKCQYEIFLLCGCSNKKIVLFSVVEILIISILQTSLGVAIFQFLVKPLVIFLEPTLKYTFDSVLYFAMFGISVLTSMVVLIFEFLFLRKEGSV